MATFGWSVGDLVASLQLIIKIAGALKESGGAKSDYQESIEFLTGLETTLKNLSSITPILVHHSQGSALELEVQKIAKPLQSFLEKVQKFEGALNSESKKASWRNAPRKVQWALSVSKEVNKLRDRISVPMFSVNILLHSQALHAMSKLHEHLPGDVSDRLASKIEDILSKSIQRDTNMDSLLHKNESKENVEVSDRNSKLEKLVDQQIAEMRSLHTCLKSLTYAQPTSSDLQKSRVLFTPGTSHFAEFRAAFAQCILLLALTLRELFDSILLYLGPQFLLFMLTFREIGSRMPKLILGTNSVLFEDVLGRRKYLPIEFFQSFNIFNTFLRESFTGVPGQEYVYDRRYQLTDAENSVIDRASWQKTVLSRSKIVMSILLERIAEDEMVCPRCWMPGSSKRPDECIDCSTCGLIYGSGVHEMIKSYQVSESGQTTLGPGGVATGPVPTATDNLAGDNMARQSDDRDQFEPTTDPIGSRKPEMARSLVSSRRIGAEGINLPWSSQDLIHFKRVQVLGHEAQVRQPQYLPLFRLLMILSRVQDILRSIMVTDLLEPISLKAILQVLMAKTCHCVDVIDSCLSYDVFGFLCPVDARDWKVEIWSKAWTTSLKLSQKSKELFSHSRQLCQYLQDHHNIDLSGNPFKPWDLTTQQFEEGAQNLKDILNILSDIEDDWVFHGHSLQQTISRDQRLEQTVGKDEDEEDLSTVQGVATCLVLSRAFIAVALDSGAILIFTHSNRFVRRHGGHYMAVWALAIEDVADEDHDYYMASGGSDRDLRIWNMLNGEPIHVLRGHTATIRCLAFIGTRNVVTGSRDTTLRVWDIEQGLCIHSIEGHTATVRCLVAKGDYFVSGSYDNTARLWSSTEGHFLQKFTGHMSQVYAVAFDGETVVTGSLDTTVKVWDARSGSCRATLQGHSSLVSQLRMQGDVLVTGSSDGNMRKWSLTTFALMFSVSAHENSLTSLEFDHRRIVTGGSDGKVKVWDLKSGKLIRHLGDISQAVWKVHISEDMAVVVKSPRSKSILEVWRFSSS